MENCALQKRSATYQQKCLREKRDAVVDSVDDLGSHVFGPSVERYYHEYRTDQEPLKTKKIRSSVCLIFAKF